MMDMKSTKKNTMPSMPKMGTGVSMMNGGSKGSSKKMALKKAASKMSKTGYKKINTSGLDNTQM
jgi:diketogulonate reductase-like aldo/keto reductase